MMNENLNANEMMEMENYVVSDEAREDVLCVMESELDNRYYNYRPANLVKITNKSYEAKQNLYNILSKHPKWDDKKLMICFDADYNRKFNKRAIGDFVDFLKHAMGYYSMRYDEITTPREVLNFMECCIDDQFFNDGMREAIVRVNKVNEELKLRTNMKASKAIGKICSVMGWDKLGGTYVDNRGVERSVFNREYAKLCDNLNPIKTTRHTCISLNPNDFLLMSNGNSWESCHYIGNDASDSGCYSSGTISYMLDETTFVFYTVDACYNGNEIEREPKMQRQIFGYKDETLFQSRLYPQGMDCGAQEIYKDIREIVQKVISDCINKPNLWKTNHQLVHDMIHKGYDATCYPDFQSGNPGHDLCRVTFNTADGNVNPKCSEITIGAEPICIYCGDGHNCSESIDCCNEYDGYYCEHCGCRISEDNSYYVDGYYYCEDCVSQCDECGEWVVNGDLTEVSDGSWVCDSCLGSYTYCDVCHTYHPDDEITEVYGAGYLCDSCLERKAVQCEECEEWVLASHAKQDEVTGKYYCEDCYDELHEEELEDAVGWYAEN